MTDRITILANSNVSRGKYAAAAVHAALNFYGIEHGAVIVLGEKPSNIEKTRFRVRSSTMRVVLR